MNRAFSLVELSIVLVILGLLTGGILAGQSLIRAAELRSVTSEQNRWVTAVGAFRDKYFALPGDMNNATSFWGAAHATPATCETTVGTGTATCNGDNTGTVNQVGGLSNEPFRFWQHLANAGLIEGSYSGVKSGSDNLGTSATNAPKAKLGSGLWYAQNYWMSTSNSSIFDGNYGNSFELGAPSVSGGNAQHPYMPLVKPEEIWNVDTKMDDGKPATGKLVVRAINGFSTCTDVANTAYTSYGANYLLSSTGVNCNFIFRQQF